MARRDQLVGERPRALDPAERDERRLLQRPCRRPCPPPAAARRRRSGRPRSGRRGRGSWRTPRPPRRSAGRARAAIAPRSPPQAMKSAPVLRLWMNSSVGKSIARSVIDEVDATGPRSCRPGRPPARARRRSRPRAAASGPPCQPSARISKARFSSAKAARIAVASPWATWHVGPAAPRRRVVHRRQVVEDQARRVDHLDRAARRQHGRGVAAQDVGHEQREDRPQPLGGANRLSSTAAATAGARAGSTRRRSAASTSRRRSSSVRSSVLEARRRRCIGGSRRHLTACVLTRSARRVARAEAVRPV